MRGWSDFLGGEEDLIVVSVWRNSECKLFWFCPDDVPEAIARLGE